MAMCPRKNAATQSHQRRIFSKTPRKEQRVRSRLIRFRFWCGFIAAISSSQSGSAFSIPQPPLARLVGGIPTDELLHTLRARGFTVRKNDKQDDDEVVYEYAVDKATGMLKLVTSPTTVVKSECISSFQAPKWIPLVQGEESVLVKNGWSFLDADESEPLSAFDVDAANLEGTYIPKWNNQKIVNNEKELRVSDLGFCLLPLSSEEIIQASQQELVQDLSRRVLLEGATDPLGTKRTHNGVDFSGAAGQSDLRDDRRGIFVCALGGLPLFSTDDLSPTTASSGWLSFARPLSDDHVRLLSPASDSVDSRTEVVCARTGCHLGHYFGKGEGYCINASALNLVRSFTTTSLSPVISWRRLEDAAVSGTPLLYDLWYRQVQKETLVLGAGCFWHVEFALRRLPGVVSTQCGYVGGTTTHPTYEDVCQSPTGHAEVVQVKFDPRVLPPRVLMDCWLALHDPTKVRAHGKHAQGTGQYRSCLFCTTTEMRNLAAQALKDCQQQLNKKLSTQLGLYGNDKETRFWPAEPKHQRHNERRLRGNGDESSDSLSTLSLSDWLDSYGTRAKSVWGSSETLAQ